MNIKQTIEHLKNRFRKEKEDDYVKVCALCEFCTESPDENGENTVFTCEKYGTVEEDHSCRKFRYDLLKREPLQRRAIPSLEYVSLDDDEEENEETKEVTNENESEKEI